MTTTHEAKLAELSARVTAIDAEVASLDSKYADLASSFESANSRDALKQASGIELKVTELRREKMLALAAQKKVTEQAKEAEAEAEQAAKQAQRVAAKGFADQICALHGEIDGELVRLRELFERRRECLRQLAETGVIDWATCTKLGSKGQHAAAACYAQLHKFIPLEIVAPGSFRTLTSANPLLQGMGREHGQERVRLNGGGGNK